MAVFCLAAALVAPVFVSCGDDDEKVVKNNADLTALTAELTACETLVNSATTDDYPQTAIDAFKKMLTDIKAAIAGDPTQTAVDNMLVQLTNAKTTFLASAYDALPSENLICAWDFDEGTGTTLTSTGTQKWNAVFTAGPSEIFGTDTQVPQFVDGVKGKALFFDKGAHLEVADYNSNTLLGSELTLSVWVKPTQTVAGNYIISLNYWNTFKFNLQNENKPFFTVATDLGIVDADNETPQSVKENEWNHLVVIMSYTTHTLKFYVNGELTKTWNTEDKPALAGTKWASWTSTTGKTLPLMIGACTTYEEATTWDWFSSTSAWDCFHGAIDQVKLFNVALTDGQVNKLYNDEK